MAHGRENRINSATARGNAVGAVAGIEQPDLRPRLRAASVLIGVLDRRRARPRTCLTAKRWKQARALAPV